MHIRNTADINKLGEISILGIGDNKNVKKIDFI